MEELSSCESLALPSAAPPLFCVSLGPAVLVALLAGLDEFVGDDAKGKGKDKGRKKRKREGSDDDDTETDPRSSDGKHSGFGLAAGSGSGPGFRPNSGSVSGSSTAQTISQLFPLPHTGLSALAGLDEATLKRFKLGEDALAARLAIIADNFVGDCGMLL